MIKQTYYNMFTFFPIKCHRCGHFVALQWIYGKSVERTNDTKIIRHRYCMDCYVRLQKLGLIDEEK